MQIRYYKEYSRFLNRFMEFKVYGHAGRPIVIFPCQSGRFFDWEDRNMCNAAEPWIDSRKLQRELGWEPSLQFEEGIERTVRWYLDNQEWMDNVTSGAYQHYYDDMYKNR